jgi:hypothetical protein
MQTTGQASPEVQMTAEKYVGTGYQRLLTFEVPGGGFSLFGNPPAEVFLTAYGLMEFNDMAEVRTVPGVTAVTRSTGRSTRRLPRPPLSPGR